MKIYNQEKTQILENPDLSAGTLQKDKILVQAHAAVAAKSAKKKKQAKDLPMDEVEKFAFNFVDTAERDFKVKNLY